MNLKEVKDLIKLMKENKLTELELEQDGFKIKLRRDNGTRVVTKTEETQQAAMSLQPVPQAVPQQTPPSVPPDRKSVV